MCEPATITAIAAASASIATSLASAASAAGGAIAAGASAVGSAVAAGASAVGGAVGSGVSALGSALGIGAGSGGGTAGGVAGGTAVLQLGAGSITDAALIATAAPAGGAGLTLLEGASLASLAAGVAGGGASAGVSAKQAAAQRSLVKANARAERDNATNQLASEAEQNAQRTFEVTAAALAARGNAKAANISDRSTRAISRAISFQEGTDKATIRRNQEVANSVASARLRGIAITSAGQKLQVGDPQTIAGVGSVNALASGLSMGAGAYRAFSRFQIPTDGPNLALVG